MIKACIFDLDGVIVDTAKYHFIAWKKLADQIGVEFTHEYNEKLKGVSRLESLELILKLTGKKYSDEEKQKMATQKNDLYVSLISKLTNEEVLPGVSDFLNMLKDNGIKCAIGSASKNAVPIIEKLKVDTYFDAIVDGNMISKAKPDPEVFLTGAKLLNTKPGNCVVFEDAKAGIEAAKAAGMRTVGIGNSEILKDADLVAKGFDELNTKIGANGGLVIEIKKN